VIKIAVATNIQFYNNTLRILLPSLLDCGIKPSDINVFIAGCDSYKKYISSNIEFINLQHNSFEYSPLIEICEKQIESEYWFLIHDTCKVGPNFKNLLYNIPQNKPEKIALRSFPSMSIGSYRYDYLMSVKEKLFSIKNTDYSENALNHWKYWGVPNEDFILWKTNPLPVIYNNIDDCVVLDYNNWYNSSSQRRTEYYKSLDLYKNKSNWGQSSVLKRNL
jgi:hypothetical protein